MEPSDAGAGGAPAEGKAKAPAKPRQNKTPLQKEVLEASYQLNQNPSVEHRKALGDRIGLSEQEVQAWFTNRRRRDKAAEKKAAATSSAASGTPGGAPPATAPGSSPAPVVAVSGAPAGTTPYVPPSAGTPAPAGNSPGSAKPKAPRAPKAPKLSPGGPLAPLAAAPSAGAPPVVAAAPSPAPGLPPPAPGAPAPGGPAGLARHVPPPPLAVGAVAAPAAGGAAGASSAAGSHQEPEEETEDGDDDVSDAAAAAWESIRTLCVAARSTLPVPYREDGPPLGFFYDEPPMPGQMLGGGSKRRRIVLGQDLVAEADEEGVKSVLLRKPGGGKPLVPGAGPVGVMTVAELEMRRRELLQLQQQQQQEDETRMADDPDYKGSGGRRAEDALRREQERLRREMLRQQERLERERKREEDERGREMERSERERKKLADKLEKERAKEEARKLKEVEKMKIAEERELRRLEAAREKERKAEERRRAVEERKKEKETARALAQHGRLVMRRREGAGGPPDDEELEYRQLLLAAGIDPATVADADEDAADAAAGGAGAAAAAAAGEGGEQPSATPPPRKRPRPDLPRPEFPPPSLALTPAWQQADEEEAAAAEAAAGMPAEGLDSGTGTELLVCWSFLRSFADLFGVQVPSLEALLGALAEGEESRLLGEVHCALLRLMQADMEDAHDERERVGRQTGAAPNFMDRSVVGYAALLEEAWAWGFEVDAWRAHLNALTWPEVLRQVALVMGRGRTRPHVCRAAGEQGASKGPRIQGYEGEDVLDDGSTGGSLKLRMPARLTHGTVKAAAWQVLASAGPSGLSVGDIVRRIQRTGLREMRSSKTPEAVVAGGLARDVLFTRVAPATWALTSVVAFHKRKNELRRMKGKTAAEQGGSSGGAAGEKAGAGAAGSGGDGDTEMAEAGKQEDEEGRAKSVGVKEEEVEEEEEGEAAGEVKHEAENDAASPMEVDGGAVKQEAVKEEPGTSPTHKSAEAGGNGGGDGPAASPEPGGDGAAATGGADGSQHQQGGQQQQQHGQEGDNEEESYSGDEEEEEAEAREGVRGAGDPWVASLLTGSYGSLGLRERIQALSFLCHAVLDGPTLRTKVDLRINEAAQRRKQLFEEAKNEKRKRQEEAAARAAAAAEEARKRAEAAAAAAAAAAGGAPAAAGSRGTTPVPQAAGAPGAVDARAIAGEIFGAAGPPDPSKAAAEAAKRAEEEEEDRQKRQKRAEELERIEEECAIRAEPLGCDRRHNRYWLFSSGADDASGNARLWVESGPDGGWRLLSSPQQLDQLVACLEPKGLREGQLAAALAKHGDRIKRCMPGGPLSEPTPLDALPPDERAALEASFCGRCEVVRLLAGGQLEPGEDYTDDLLLPEEDSERMRRLKRDMLRLEAAVPAEAVDDAFNRSSWIERVQAAPSAAALRTCLGQLEAALLPSPDGAAPGLLATVFHRQPPLVRGAWVEVGREVATALPGHASKEVLPPQERHDGQPAAAPNDEPLAWLPPTLPAVMLRLLALDAAIIYRQGTPPGRDCLAGYKYTVRPAPLDAQPAVVAAAAGAGAVGEGAAPPASAALPTVVGGGAVVLTNVLADRGRVREASRRVPDLPTEVMTLRAHEFALPVEEMRESVAEADRQGFLTAAATAAPSDGKGKGKGKGTLTGKGAAAAGAKGGAAAAGGAKGSRSVVVVSGGRGVGAAAGGGSKSKGGSKAKGGAAAGGSKAKGGKSAGAAAAARGKSQPPATEEPEGEEDWMTGEQLGEPVLLGPEDEDELGFSDDDDGPEEGYDDPYDSDYR